MQEETEQLSTQINALKAGIATEVRLPFLFHSNLFVFVFVSCTFDED
jgi:hypothetical protein